MYTMNVQPVIREELLQYNFTLRVDLQPLYRNMTQWTKRLSTASYYSRTPQ